MRSLSPGDAAETAAWMVPLLTTEPRSAYCCSRTSIVPLSPLHSRHFCRSPTVAAPGQAKIEAISPAVSAPPHFLESEASVLVMSFESAPEVFGSLGGMKLPPENAPMQTGDTFPAVPRFSWVAMHFCVALRAPWKTLRPCLPSSFTQAARSLPVPGQASLVTPLLCATINLPDTSCCDSMQLEIAVSSVPPPYAEVSPACAASSPHCFVIDACAFAAAFSILAVSVASGQAPAGCFALHFERVFIWVPRYLAPALAIASWHFRPADEAMVMAAGVRSSHVAAAPATCGTARAARAIRASVLDIRIPPWLRCVGEPRPGGPARHAPAARRGHGARGRKLLGPEAGCQGKASGLGDLGRVTSAPCRRRRGHCRAGSRRR